jgi:peptidoglycan hydrolase CwlO-like protein
MDVSLSVSIVAALSAIVGAYLTYRSSSRATDVESKKVDQVAYDKAIDYYEKQLDRVTQQVDRLSSQLERVNTQLASEQDVSNTLRNQVRILQGQVELLNETLNQLRARTTMHVDPKTPKPPEKP